MLTFTKATFEHTEHGKDRLCLIRPRCGEILFEILVQSA